MKKVFQLGPVHYGLVKEKCREFTSASQIRKAKREEQLSKRRNVCVLEEGELGGPDQDDIVSSSGMSPGAGVLVPNAASPQQEPTYQFRQFDNGTFIQRA